MFLALRLVLVIEMNTWNLLQMLLFFFQPASIFPFMGNISKWAKGNLRYWCTALVLDKRGICDWFLQLDQDFEIFLSHWIYTLDCRTGLEFANYFSSTMFVGIKLHKWKRDDKNILTRLFHVLIIKLLPCI